MAEYGLGMLAEYGLGLGFWTKTFFSLKMSEFCLIN